MRISSMLVASTALLILIPEAQGAPRYVASNLMHGGYHDDQITPNSWFISGVSVGEEGATAIALYRAAALVDATGASEVRITKQMIKQRHEIYGGGVKKETALLKVVAVRSPADRQLCEMKSAERCVTVSTATLMAQYGPLLGQPTIPKTKTADASSTRSTSLARLPVAPPKRSLSPYEAGRAAGEAALAASGGAN